ncbi:hypothetical protein [Methanorbis rubei]|uniref:Uncharacterized protein n=1 Tax=Methanorbis rubei TaxID=3028300 RepID=A0AAE4SAX5_9EURY|nr:hypothetical protein [Methanocorpusculaceae archaeon Cs1]
MITAAEILNDCLLPSWPRPENLFERAYWCTELEGSLHRLSLLFNEEFNTTVSQITAGNLTSPAYELRFPQVAVRRVNVPLLREEMPKMFSAVAYLRATDAERILSRKLLYELCLGSDPDRTASLAAVNIADLEKFLTRQEMDGFVLTDQKPLRPVIVKLGEDA